MGIREEKAKFTAEIVERIECALAAEFDTDMFRTGDNYNTVTFSVGEFKNKELYGSVKFTLHKDNYDLDEDIELFEDFDEMRTKAREDLARRKALKEAKNESAGS